MRIVRYVGNGAPAWGVLDGDQVLATAGEPFRDLVATHPHGPLADVALLAPVHPRTIVCVGRNYAAHAEEFGNEPPERPILFLKPASSVIGPGADIIHPAASVRVDSEAELVVIGSSAHKVPRSDAHSVIGGYVAGNDVTARDLQKSDPGGQWTRGKGFDTFCPIGPWVDTAFNLGDVRVTCAIDGELCQDGRTRDFLFDIPFLIEYITAFTRLEPGDLVMTGTPSGVRPMPVGATATVSIEGLGDLVNRVVAEPAG